MIVAVHDPAIAREVALPRPGLAVGDNRLPAITEPSETDLYAAMMRRSMPGVRGPGYCVVMYYNLHHGRLDVPFCVGPGGRAAIVLCLSAKARPDLDDLRAALSAGDPVLELHGGEDGLRAVLRLGDGRTVFTTLLHLTHGDVQEFLAAAHATEAIDLHLGHKADERLLAFAYRAHGIRAILESALGAPAEASGAGGTVRLEHTGAADLAIRFEVNL